MGVALTYDTVDSPIENVINSAKKAASLVTVNP
jgi:hypothetical protein